MKTIFFDVDTQFDFLDPAGALYVPGAETIVDRIAALNHWAASRGIPVVSTVDAHTEDDPEFRDWPPHCIAGTPGQRKPSATLLDQRVIVANTPGLPALEAAQQIVIEKQTFDCFSNVNLKAALRELGGERYIVYGVVTEICVRLAALGLQKMGLKKTSARVEIVTDAIRSLNDANRDQFFAEFQAAGGVLTTSAEVMASAPES